MLKQVQHDGGDLGDDRDTRFEVSLRDEPAEKQEIWRECYSIALDMERTLRAIRKDVHDCNIIMARTIDKLVRFNATEGPSDACR